MQWYARLMAAQPGQFWFFVTLWALAGPLVLWHKLGHAVAARLFTTDEVGVHVGRGERWAFRLGGVDFRIGTPALFGIGGFCRYRADLGALEQLVVVLAGPLATLLGMEIAFQLMSRTHGPVHAAAAVAALVQAQGFVLNLVPIGLTDRSGRRWRTDGRQALDALRHLSLSTRAPRARTASPALTPRFVSARALSSPLCARCGHRRDEHVDLETGRRGGCLGQDYDFQSLSARRCSCAAFAWLT